MSSENIVFKPTEDFTWESDEGIIVQVGHPLTTVSSHREFDDMIDVLDYIYKICGKRPLFEINEETANVSGHNRLGTVDDPFVDDKPKTC